MLNLQRPLGNRSSQIAHTKSKAFGAIAFPLGLAVCISRSGAGVPCIRLLGRIGTGGAIRSAGASALQRRAPAACSMHQRWRMLAHKLQVSGHDSLHRGRFVGHGCWPPPRRQRARQDRFAGASRLMQLSRKAGNMHRRSIAGMSCGRRPPRHASLQADAFAHELVCACARETEGPWWGALNDHRPSVVSSGALARSGFTVGNRRRIGTLQLEPCWGIRECLPQFLLRLRRASADLATRLHAFCALRAQRLSAHCVP